jgi:hypothetical protein
MKIKITDKPKFKQGGFFFMPYAGILSTNPHGLINSDVKNLDSTYNDTVKPIDEEKANVEAEKGEFLFKFDAGGIFKIAGKKHSQGGTPLKVDSGDFIFSNDKKLAITKKEAEVFKLKFSERGKHLNTPAKLLDKEIDAKKYNKFLAVLNDPNADPISKTTAQLMLGKYMEKIGQLGYLQEAKKNFPQGLPTFAEGTAPVYANEVKDAEDKAKMFAKQGGTYLPQAQLGLYGKPFGVQKQPKSGSSTSSPRQDRYIGVRPPYPTAWKNYFDKTENKQYSAPDWIDPKTFYETPGLIDFMKTLDSAPGIDNDLKKADDAWWGYRHQAAFNKFFPNGRPQTPITGTVGPVTDKTGTKYNIPNLPEEALPATPGAAGDQNPKPNSYNAVPTVPFQGFNIGMNAAEVLSGIAPYMAAMSQPTYYDMLTQKYSPNIRLERATNSQEVNQIQQQTSLAQKEMFANLPGGIAALASADLRANELSNINRSNQATDNVNAGVENQEAMVNYQTDQQDNLFNLQNIHQTYNNNVLAQQRKNEMLTNGAIQSTNNFLAIKGNLDTLNQQATAAVLPYLSEIDAMDANGNPIKVQVPPITLNQNRMPVPTGFGSLDSVGVRNLANTPDSTDYKSAYEYFINKGVSPDKASQAATIIFYGRNGQKGAQSYNAANPYAAMMSGLYNF